MGIDLKKFDARTKGEWKSSPISTLMGSVIAAGEFRADASTTVAMVTPRKSAEELAANVALVESAPALLGEVEKLREALAPIVKAIEQTRSTWEHWDLDEGSKLGVYISRPSIEAILKALGK